MTFVIFGFLPVTSGRSTLAKNLRSGVQFAMVKHSIDRVLLEAVITESGGMLATSLFSLMVSSFFS
jgi:hypothetical protein